MHETRRPGCARVRTRLALALDGGLAPLEATLDRGHLEACVECQRERAQHERLLAAIRQVSVPREADLVSHEADLELVSAAVRARLPALPALRREPWWSAPSTLVAAAAAVLLIVLLATMGTDSTPRSVDLATLDRLLERLPSWADVVRGLNTLPRSFS